MRARSMVRKQGAADLSVEPGSREVVARITTTAVDREGDVVLPSGADLVAYRENPVVLYVHESRKLPVGTARKFRKETDGITVKYALAERPASLPAQQEWLPDTLHELLQAGVIRGHSIGFMIKDGGARAPNDKEVRRFGASVRRIITDWELVEFSIVPVPANPEALTLAVSKGLITSEQALRLGLAITRPVLSISLPRLNLRPDGSIAA